VDFDADVLYRFFRESLESVDTDRIDFNLAIANSVIWACAVDEALTARSGDSYAAARDADPNGRVLDGLRLARNAILHGQTFAVQPTGLGYPLEYPLFYGPPVWKSYAELTRDWTPRNKGPGLDRLRDTYEHNVAGRNIGAPLWDSRDWLDAGAALRWDFGNGPVGPTCPRCGAGVTPIRSEEASIFVDGSHRVDSSEVVGWRCDNDHVLAAGDVA
jgi:hypothetical protein